MISTARNAVVKTIPITGLASALLAISPDGTTAFTASVVGNGTHRTWMLVPINTATNKPGKPIVIARQPASIVFTR